MRNSFASLNEMEELIDERRPYIEDVQKWERIQAKFGQFLSRGIADAIRRCAEQRRATLVLDDGEDNEMIKRLSNALAAWRFPLIRTCGVQYLSGTGPMYERLDMNHTHILSLRRRETSGFSRMQEALVGGSAKCDVAMMLRKCYKPSALRAMPRYYPSLYRYTLTYTVRT